MISSGPMVRYRKFQTVMGPLIGVLHPKSSILFYFFNFRSNCVLMISSGPMVRYRYFQSVIGPLNWGSMP